MSLKSNFWKLAGLSTVMLLNLSSYPSLAMENTITKQGGSQAEAILQGEDATVVDDVDATVDIVRTMKCNEVQRIIYTNKTKAELNVLVDVTNKCNKAVVLDTAGEGGSFSELHTFKANSEEAINVSVPAGNRLRLFLGLDKVAGEGITYEVTN